MSTPRYRACVPKPRVRPTREETRDRIFVAAAETFARVGIMAATVEEITASAGLTRGAFYSSFANKDELVVELLNEHMKRSIERNQRLAAQYSDPHELMNALETGEGRTTDLATLPMLNLELMLYAIRKPDQRQAVSEMLQTLRTVVGEIAVSSLRSAGVTRQIDPQLAGAMLMALEDGYDLHRLIDPQQTAPDAYFVAVRELQSLLINPPAVAQ
jgi:AcrR family transcriptional regulator